MPVFELVPLKNGAVTTDRRLDRVYEEDWTSLLFRVARGDGVDPGKAPRSYTWPLSLWLDQYQEGACVWFGISHELAASPAAVTGLSNEYARQGYFQTQREDPWPGGAYPGATPFYEGTSVLTGVKVAQRLGYYSSYRWGVTLREVVLGVGYTGPAILGLNWYSGMFDTDVDGFIAPTGYLAGGHCILAVGVTIRWRSWVNRFVSRTWENVDLDRSYLTLHNSWGQGWGANGRAKITLRNFERLLHEAGEACFPVRNLGRRATEPGDFQQAA